jgi:hypothetical protein
MPHPFQHESNPPKYAAQRTNAIPIRWSHAKYCITRSTRREAGFLPPFFHAACCVTCALMFVRSWRDGDDSRPTAPPRPASPAALVSTTFRGPGPPCRVCLVRDSAAARGRTRLAGNFLRPCAVPHRSEGAEDRNGGKQATRSRLFAGTEYHGTNSIGYARL